ncbi:hypothetical protein LG302_07365 [Halomonas organivorans]
MPIVLCGLLASGPSDADDWELQSLSLRARVSEKTLLGKEAPEDFKEYDLSANVALPWEAYSTSGWGMGTRLMASAGVLRGAGENALVVSLIPEWALGSEDGRFLLDLGPVPPCSAGIASGSRISVGPSSSP